MVMNEKKQLAVSHQDGYSVRKFCSISSKYNYNYKTRR